MKTNQIIKAARGFKLWGNYAARKYAERQGLDARLVRLARQLEAASGF